MEREIERERGGSFYIAQYPVRCSKRFTHFALPDRPVDSDTNSASPGSILVRQQLRAKTKSLTFPTLSIARYSFIQLSRLGRQWRERKYQIFETVAKRDFEPGLSRLRVRHSTTELPRSMQERERGGDSSVLPFELITPKHYRYQFLYMTTSRVATSRSYTTRRGDKGDKPSGGETTCTNAGGSRSGRGQRKTC